MRVLALGCEIVNFSERNIFGNPNIINKLGRVTVVDRFETIVLDEYIKPKTEVRNYGCCNKLKLMIGKELSEVAAKVASLIDGCILVGYDLSSELHYLGLAHPEANRRDLAVYEPFLQENNGDKVELRVLAKYFVSRTLITKNGEQDSADKANACMELYRMFETNW